MYARLQGRSTQPIEMALMPEILIRSQLGIDALRLEHDSDLAAKACGILRGIEAHDQGAAAGRNHQCRKNAEERSFSAAVGAQQAEQFGRPYVEAHAVQSCAALVSVNEILNRNDGRGGRVNDFRAGIYDWRDFRGQRESPGTRNSLRHSEREQGA